MPRRPWRPRRHKRLRRDESSCDPPYLKGALTDAASMSQRKGRMISRARPCDFAKGDELRPRLRPFIRGERLKFVKLADEFSGAANDLGSPRATRAEPKFPRIAAAH